MRSLVSFSRVALVCGALLPGVFAADAKTKSNPKRLVYLGLNEQGAEEWLRTKDGAVVIRVPRGEFLARPYEGRVAVLKPKPLFVESFFVDKTEVTNAQFARFLNARKSTDGLVRAGVPGLVRRRGGWRPARGRGGHPVTAATGAGAIAYAKWVGGMLPTKAEWEKAAGGPKGLLYPWGKERPDADRANFGWGKLRGLLPVGSFQAGASPYGCLDMAGNAYERVHGGAREQTRPVMIKGGSWLSPHPLNLRVLDLCMQPMDVAERSVGFRCVMADPDPKRATLAKKEAPVLRLAKTFEAGVEEARKRRVPIFLSLQHDTCGQCDRIRAGLFTDPKFVDYCNRNLVVIVGHDPAHAGGDPHPSRKDGSCTLYPGLRCVEHLAIFRAGLQIVGRFQVSPGNFVLNPFECKPGQESKSILVWEEDLPKWGEGTDTYLKRFEAARKKLQRGHGAAPRPAGTDE